MRPKFILCTAAFVLVLTCIGCGGSPRMFGLVKKDQKVRPRTLAIVAGDSDEVTYKLVQRIIKDLQKKSKFRVLSQRAIENKVPGYPRDVVRIEVSATDNYNKPWMPPGSKGFVNYVQRKTGARHVIIIWTENLQVVYGQGTRAGFSTYARMLQYPGGKVIGYSHFRINDGAIFKDADDIVESIIKSSADEFVQKLLSETRAAR